MVSRENKSRWPVVWCDREGKGTAEGSGGAGTR